ncbi:DUF2808 domain-containing protein [Calothrix rhizosoleniae]|uniref:DUF2808 domain-containing protein n=1 Tax=Calothrix rhizosoleniae TaxID=888997 RepID=UPI000B4A4B1B|nr:DUF2808 domain-containing protein [Calothrix rhizosoleniae]
MYNIRYIKYIELLFATTLIGTIFIKGFSALPTQAVQLRDGKVYFVQPPRLVKVITTYNRVRVSGVRYYFTISLPENAGEPLQKVTINQYQGLENIDFRLKKTISFVGTPSRRGKKIPLQDVTRDKKSRTVSITFDPPVYPGTTITIGLKPYYNPMHGGIYLFGVTGFPVGEKSHGQFMGFGRLHFYGYDRGYFFWR